jgi:hypothetical protein
MQSEPFGGGGKEEVDCMNSFRAMSLNTDGNSGESGNITDGCTSFDLQPNFILLVKMGIRVSLPG